MLFDFQYVLIDNEYVKRIFIITLIAGIIAATIGFILTFPRLPICHSPQKVGKMTPSDPIFSSDGSQIAFLGYVLIQRWPVGICAFPDGGMPLIVGNEMQIYTTDLNTNSTKLIFEIPLVHGNVLTSSLGSQKYGILGWDNDSIYFWMYYPNNGDGKSHYIQVHSLSGEYSEISAEQGKILKQKYWGQARFNPINESEWVAYDSDTNSIGIYIGGDLKMNKERRSLSTSGSPPTKRIKTIVDQSTIKELQPLTN